MKLNSGEEYCDSLEALEAGIDIGLAQVKSGDVTDLDFEQLMRETD